jgi:hypothetical protein
MLRREFIAGLVTAAAWRVVARAQQVRRVGTFVEPPRVPGNLREFIVTTSDCRISGRPQ